MYVERCKGRQTFLHSTSRLLFFWLSDREILNRGKFSMSGNKGVCVHKALVRGCDNVSQIKLVFIYIILFKYHTWDWTQSRFPLSLQENV